MIKMVGTAAAVILIAGCGTSSSSDVGTTTESSSQSSSAAPTGTLGGPPVTNDQASVQISLPYLITTGQYPVGAISGGVDWAVKVTYINLTDKTQIQGGSVSLSAQLDRSSTVESCPSLFDSSKYGTPSEPVPAGKTHSWELAFSCPKADSGTPLIVYANLGLVPEKTEYKGVLP